MKKLRPPPYPRAGAGAWNPGHIEWEFVMDDPPQSWPRCGAEVGRVLIVSMTLLGTIKMPQQTCRRMVQWPGTRSPHAASAASAAAGSALSRYTVCRCMHSGDLGDLGDVGRARDEHVLA